MPRDFGRRLSNEERAALACREFGHVEELANVGGRVGYVCRRCDRTKVEEFDEEGNVIGTSFIYPPPRGQYPISNRWVGRSSA